VHLAVRTHRLGESLRDHVAVDGDRDRRQQLTVRDDALPEAGVSCVDRVDQRADRLAGDGDAIVSRREPP